jgi:hypothetical protein
LISGRSSRGSRRLSHEFIIDDQIGVRCKDCNVVDLEIRHVLPHCPP